MHLPRLLRTTSFRLTLLYAALFCASVLVLFGAMFWYGTGYVADEIDHTVANEIEEIHIASQGADPAGLQKTVAAYTAHAPPGIFYLLEDAHRKVIAGNVAALDPIQGVRNWTEDDDVSAFSRTVEEVRGFGTAVPGGGYLFVGVDSHQLAEMREMIARAFLWGLIGTVLLALVGGAVMSAGLLRRVEAISQASREIIAGDLGRRIDLRGSNDEFDHLAASLNAMLDRIESLMNGLREVSTDIAHDLRTPLTRLRQRLELARQASASLEELHGAVERSIGDVDSILETFSALLRIAQIEAHTKAARFEEVSLSEILIDMADTYTSVAEEYGHRLTARIAPDLRIVGDRELLPQLFSNLIENAIRHCPRGAVIAVEADRMPSRSIDVTISDNGPGIPAAMRAKVFQRFFRLEQSRTTEGTGLGLSLCAAIAALHRARIELSDNRPGLRVRLQFPASDQTV